MMNLTISVPDGTTNHGNPQLLCFPSGWTDIVTFLVTNYYAHAATVLLDPGVASRRVFILVFAALILPFSGISRAVRAIWRHAVTERKNPLKRAARSRALCMVMKTPKSGPFLPALRSVRTWAVPKEDVIAHMSANPERSNAQSVEGTANSGEKRDGDSTKPFDDPSASRWWEVTEGYEPIPKHSTVHGEYWLNEEYYLAFVPDHADLAFAQPPKAISVDSPGTMRQEPMIPNSYSFLQSFIGFAQGLWAIITIYQARGDQIQQYGYAAFGLTVVPYAFMSVVNALAALLTPQYATLFLIRTPAMTEAEQRGKAFFEAAYEVELLEVPASAVPSKWRAVIQFYVPLLLGVIPVAIIGGLSKFQAGHSTRLQRGFTMTWLAMGIVAGFAIHGATGDPGDPLEEEEEKKRKAAEGKKYKKKHLSIKQYLQDDAACESSGQDMAVFFITLLLSPPAIGGMVVVGLMINDYGNCSLVGS